MLTEQVQLHTGCSAAGWLSGCIYCQPLVCLLPTPENLRPGCGRYGYARMYSGVSLDTFQKKMTVQSLTEQGLRNVGPAVAHMASVEGLDAHRRAVTMRLGLPN